MPRVLYSPGCGCLVVNCKHKEFVPVLNWYAKNRRWTKGLRQIFQYRRNGGPSEEFVTLRLGVKYANKYKPGDIVALSVSDDESTPNVIGFAEISCVLKIYLCDVSNHYLSRNIGAKTKQHVLKDMRGVYGTDKVGADSVVSVLVLRS